MWDDEPCGFCRDWWSSYNIKPGVRKLKKFKGYTVDMRLKELRNINAAPMEFVPFDSPKGQTLLNQMHKKMLKAANILF